MRKKYVHKQVTYGFSPSHRKWAFDGGSYTLYTPVPGGAETAHKIAALVSGSLDRTKGKGIDGAGRTGINKLTSLRPGVY